MEEERLTAQELRRQLEGLLGPARAGRVRCMERADSTNSLLKELARSGAEGGSTLIALEQSAGRGRLGRSFTSPPGGLYLSTLLEPGDAAAAASITAWAGVAAAEAVEEVCRVPCGIKWVNDLQVQGKKVCGILAEGVRLPSGGSRVVLGLGLNVRTPRAAFPPEVREIAASLSEFAEQELRIPLLAAALIRRLDRLGEDYPARGAEYLEAYRRRCVTLGREVLLDGPEGEERAFAEDLGEDFSLLLRLPDGSRRSVRSGEVRLKRL